MFRQFAQFRECSVYGSEMQSELESRAPARARASARALGWFVRLAALLVGLGVIGCRGSDGVPSLIQLAEVSPRRGEPGDRVEIVGSGFPEGRPATVTFDGTLARAGQRVQRSVRVVAAATSTSQSRLELVLGDELIAELCGRGDEAQHTTFRGRVVAAFAPRSAAAPPVTGALEGVVLDVTPRAPRRDVAEHRVAEGRRFVAFLGIEATSVEDGLQVQGVVTHSRAELAGITPGDRLAELDGVTVLSLADLVPAPERKSAALGVRRGRLPDLVPRVVDVQGFTATAPVELIPAALVTVLVALALILAASRLGRALTWLDRRAARRAARSGGASWPALVAPLRAALVTLETELGAKSAWLRFVPTLWLLGVGAVFTWIALGRDLAGRDLDLGVIVLAACTASVVAGLVLGGFRPVGTWSLAAGLRGSLHSALLELPLLAAATTSVVAVGSLRIRDVALAQGAAPWAWRAFESPGTLLVVALTLLSALPEPSRRPAALPEAEGESFPRPVTDRPAARALAFVAEWGRTFVLAGLVATLFLGAWQLPGVTPGEQSARIGLRVLGVACLHLKLWAVVLLVVFARWLLPRLDGSQVSRLAFRWLAPATIASVGASVAWAASTRDPFVRSIAPLVAGVSFGAVMLVLVYLLVRVGRAGRSTVPGINPWL